MKKGLLPVLLFAFLAACSGADTAPATTVVPEDLPTVTPTFNFSPTQIPTLASSLTPDMRLPPERWQEWPIVLGMVSARTIKIFQHGQELGNNPQAFSKIGDCESTPTWFLGSFDGKPGDYSLGRYTDLQSVINVFHGSYRRTSLAAGRGFTSANALTSLWADRKSCEANETPLACEIRVNRPSFALIMLGTNDVYH